MAFAFAAADVLVEVDVDGRILFIIGAVMALVGRPARLLADTPLFDLFTPQDRPRVAKALKRMAAGARVRHVLLSAELPGGERVPVALSGYSHPDKAGCLLCVLTHGGGLVTPRRQGGEGGLLDRGSFQNLALSVMSESRGGEDPCRMTLLDLPDLPEMTGRLGTARTAEFLRKIAVYLRDCSLGGDSAGALGQAKYGVIHGADVTADDIERTVGSLVSTALGPDWLTRAAATSVTLDANGLSDQEAVRALAYTINAFVQDEENGLKSLAQASAPHLSVTVAQMRAVKDIIEAERFELFVQPIVDLWTGGVHHFEVLVRFKGENESPFETIVFAEQVGLAGELDLAICRRSIAFMRSPVAAQAGLKFAVNVSGASLSSASAAARLLGLIHEARDLRGRLLFEVTESAQIEDLAAANAIIQEIRGLGHPVGLDDFGAGSAAFHYLRGLNVDHVKIDGSYIRGLTETSSNAPFLRAITQLCRELRVATVAEHIEDEATANLLRLYNVRYGQGYYFGKPCLPHPVEARDVHGAWASSTLRWRNGLLFFAAPARRSTSCAPDGGKGADES